MGSAQNLCPLNIVEAGHYRTVAAFIEVVLEEGGGRITPHAKVLGADAAHADRVNVGVLRVTADARGIGDQVFNVVEVGVGNEITG